MEYDRLFRLGWDFSHKPHAYHRVAHVFSVKRRHKQGDNKLTKLYQLIAIVYLLLYSACAKTVPVYIYLPSA